MRSIALALSALVVAAMSAQAQNPDPVVQATATDNPSPVCTNTATTSSCVYTHGTSNAAFTAGPFPAGNVTSSASNNESSNTGFVTSSGLANYYESVTINQLSDPISDVYYIVLRSADNASASTDDPDGTSVDAYGYLEAGASDFSSGANDKNDQMTTSGNSTASSSRPLEVTIATSGTYDAPNPYPNLFYYEIESFAQITDAGTSTNLNASAFVDAPVITLEDANGKDITTNYTLTYDPAAPVTTTPEPASLSLMATGLVGLGGFVRRRKKSAA